VAPPAEHGALSARTVLEVADGLRWTDPRLGAALAEHALRLAGDDDAVRTAAQRSLIRSVAEVDRFDEVVTRAVPLLDAASRRDDRDEVAALLVELAGAATGLADEALAAHLVEPVGSATGLPPRTVAHAALLRAQLAGSTGDVAATDTAAEEAEAALLHLVEPETVLVRRDLARARAAARRRGGDPVSALTTVSGVVSTDPGADADGGRRSLLAAADEVELLLDLGRRDEALARGRAVLPPDSAAPLVVCPSSRIRVALAERVHLVGGAYAEAQALARTAATQLEAAGHEATAARAWEVVASAAERGGELGEALSAVRHAHELESRSRDRRDPALRILAMVAAAGPELPAAVVPRPEAGAASDQPGEPAPGPVSSTLSDVEALLADARSSVASGADGSSDLPRRRNSHRYDQADAAGARSGAPEPGTMPEALARLLGGGSPAGPAPTRAPAEQRNGHGAGGSEPPEAAGDLPTTTSPPGPGVSRRSRHAVGLDEGADDASPRQRSRDGGPPTFDALPAVSRDDRPPTTNGSVGADDQVHEPALPYPAFESPTSWSVPDPAEFPHIDPADPLGTGSSWGATPARSSGTVEVNGAALPPPAPGGRDEAVDGQVTGPARGDEAEPGPVTTPVRRDGAERGSGVDRVRPNGTGPGRPDDERRDGSVRGPTAEAPSPARPSVRDGEAGRPHGTPPAAIPLPPEVDPDDPDGELALTLAGLLAEYQGPAESRPGGDDRRQAADVAVPAARPHASGSMAVPATEQRFTPRPADAPAPAPASTGAGPAGRGRRGENGARLADLLAEAMDAFRHTGPGEGTPDNADGDGARGPGVGSRRR
jgi:hypothetical protein